MKKLIAVLLSAVMLVSLSACGKSGGNAPTPIGSVDSYEKLKTLVKDDLDETISTLNAEWMELKSKTETLDAYLANKELLVDFYAKIDNDLNELYPRLEEYTISYAHHVLLSDKSLSEKSSDIDKIKKLMYSEARDKIYDEIRADLLDNMYSLHYMHITDEPRQNGANSEMWEMYNEIDHELFELDVDAGNHISHGLGKFRSYMFDFWGALNGMVFIGNVDNDSINHVITEYQERMEKEKNWTLEDEEALADSFDDEGEL